MAKLTKLTFGISGNMLLVKIGRDDGGEDTHDVGVYIPGDREQTQRLLLRMFRLGESHRATMIREALDLM